MDDVNSYVGQAFSSSSPLVGENVAGADVYLQRDVGTVGQVELVLVSASHVLKGTIGSVDASTLGETAIGGGGPSAWTLVKFRLPAGQSYTIAAGDIIALHAVSGLDYYNNERVYYPSFKNIGAGFDASSNMVVKHLTAW